MLVGRRMFAAMSGFYLTSKEHERERGGECENSGKQKGKEPREEEEKEAWSSHLETSDYARSQGWSPDAMWPAISYFRVKKLLGICL